MKALLANYFIIHLGIFVGCCINNAILAQACYPSMAVASQLGKVIAKAHELAPDSITKLNDANIASGFLYDTYRLNRLLNYKFIQQYAFYMSKRYAQILPNDIERGTFPEILPLFLFKRVPNSVQMLFDTAVINSLPNSTTSMSHWQQSWLFSFGCMQSMVHIPKFKHSVSAQYLQAYLASADSEKLINRDHAVRLLNQKETVFNNVRLLKNSSEIDMIIYTVSEPGQFLIFKVANNRALNLTFNWPALFAIN
jgi:hypothetical protein